jgi:hypothetical protein
LARRWDDLRTTDAAIAGQHLRWLVDQPKETIPFLRAQIATVPVADNAVIEKHIAGLDHDQFRRREIAFKALQELGDVALPAIRDALGKQPSPEVSERLQKLLHAEVKITVEQRRLLRAIEALERIGTDDALALLTTWSQGAPGALLTREAQSAKQRLRPSH